jgi:hypothetical protein
MTVEIAIPNWQVLPRGIDISLIQKEIDFHSLKASGAKIDFAIVRFGQGAGADYADPYRNTNYAAVKEIFRRPRGAYWVWDETRGAKAKNHISGLDAAWGNNDPPDIRIWNDLEKVGLHWEWLHDLVKHEEDKFQEKPGFYSGNWYLQTVMPIPDWALEYDWWITGYNDIGPTAVPGYDLIIVFWQKSNQGEYPGIPAKTDENVFLLGDKLELWRYANMAKMVPIDELIAWLDANSVECDSSGGQPPAPPPVPPPADEFTLAWPVAGEKIVTQAYGINPQNYKQFGLPGHEGIDIRAVTGTPVMAAAPGEIIRVETDAASSAYGIHVRIKHLFKGEEYRTVYAHFQKPNVALGDKVITGQVIGFADNTGNSSGAHLHVTLKHIGKGSPWMNSSDIINPTPYFPDLFPGKGWLVDVGGNFRTSPEEKSDNLIRWIAAGNKITATGEIGGDGGDWWKITFSGIAGWFWNPGYKLRAT